MQKHIVTADEKQKVADYKFDVLYAKASSSISEINEQMAATDAHIAVLTELTASGGKKTTGGNKRSNTSAAITN